MMNKMMTGAERRSARRANEVEAFTRAQALGMVVLATSVEECERLSRHPSNRVRRCAFAKALKLSMQASATSYTARQSEFERLVERFTALGKKDPVRSARASLAATAQAAQKRAPRVEATA